MFILVVAAIALTALGAWLSQAVFFAAAAKLPPKLQEPFTSRYAVDPYIWTEPAFRPLRRRYAGAQALLVVAFALWALIAMSYYAVLGLSLAVIAGLGAVFLAYRVFRHGL